MMTMMMLLRLFFYWKKPGEEESRCSGPEKKEAPLPPAPYKAQLSFAFDHHHHPDKLHHLPEAPQPPPCATCIFSSFPPLVSPFAAEFLAGFFFFFFFFFQFSFQLPF
jgi:hypothetical protein